MPTVFISHITRENKIASSLKSEIDDSLLGGVQVFQSSDPNSIGMGDNWLKVIDQNLNTCDALILLVSPESVDRPWINFEFGAAWARRISVIPIVHSGMTLGKLPIPMSLQQGFELTNTQGMQGLIGKLAGLANLRAPVRNYEKFCSDVKRLEDISYKYREALIEIKSIDEEVYKFLCELKVEAGQFFPREYPERIFEKMRESFDALKSGGFIEYEYGGVGPTDARGIRTHGMIMSNRGNFGYLGVLVKPLFIDLKNEVQKSQ
ncbi:toll/interleukin-1 receptor domain-containing protein [Acetobacter orientalis]|uniref:toll/interleukin-1 receptor domain-containing protein n=1 Tax=Acetobacter orientalis TaxID=146474 RepID=UPI0039EBE4A7